MNQSRLRLGQHIGPVAESDVMPNMIVHSDGLTPRVVLSTKADIDQDTQMEILPFVNTYTDEHHTFKRSEADTTKWKTPEDFYQDNLAVADAKVDVTKAIIPTPKHINFSPDNRQLDISKGINVALNQVNSVDVDAALARLASLGVMNSENGAKVSLTISPDENKMIGSYSLSIDGSGINIVGVDASGVFNGLQSVASLYKVGEKHLPYVTIEDEPLYEFRGLLLDVARNFRDKDFVLGVLDQMAAYKLNKLHLHMAEDEGWRLEIPGLEELTQISSKRCFDLTEQACLMPQLGAGLDAEQTNNGFYSVQDYVEILQAASARHIQVLPSLDMPGHSRAAIKAMEARYNKFMALEDQEKAEEYLLHDINDKTVYSSVQFYNDNTINACQESSFNFIEKVMKEVKDIHEKAGQPLTRYHIGADETAGAWIESDVCKAFIANNDKGVTEMKQLGAYFVERVSNMISDMGIEPGAWSDGLEHTSKENMPAVVQANAWVHLPWGAHNVVNDLANRNWQVVLSTPDVTYFDFPYEADPKEHGYYWASRRTNTEKVFQFMPENVPVHAEFWTDRQGNAYEADDRLQKDEQGNITHKPLDEGRQFLGIQAQLWSENVRTDNIAHYKIFPRVIALAERAWHKPEWAVPYNYQGAKYNRDSNVFSDDMRTLRDQQWQDFATVLGSKELVKLDLAEIKYRLPTVGAKIEEGILYANIALPGIAIEYRDQANKWQPYSKPVKVQGKVDVRSMTSDGMRKSRIVSIEQ